MQVDAIVNAANTGLVGGAGLCGMIHDTAGPEIDIECRKIGHCLRGEAVITKGYKLPADEYKRQIWETRLRGRSDDPWGLKSESMNLFFKPLQFGITDANNPV